MLTAEEARLLDPAGQIKSDLERLETMIRAKASIGEKTVRVPYDMTDHKGYDMWFKTPGVQDALEDAGYTINTRSEERQFVDLWLEISWPEKAA